MGYDIHIQRSKAITLAEWRAAASAVDGIRLCSADKRIKTPDGELLVPGTGGDADVFLPQEGRWLSVFLWRPRTGDVVFRAPPDFEDHNSLIRTKARQLAAALGAQLIGDEGEPYE
jgi:hypothetical protein